ncbi:MAG: PEP-utilizing enzyme [Candidatus Micrarchaeota archaeon]
MAQPAWMAYDLAQALEANSAFAGEALVLQANENSDLLEHSKECSKEFLGRVFAAGGPMWQAYAKTRMGFAPVGCRHANFVGGRLYFCRNVEKRFLRAPGPEKTLALSGGKVVERTHWTLHNLLLALAMPFDSIGQAIDGALLGLYADEKMRAFPAFAQAAAKFAGTEISQEAPWQSASEALAGAVAAMDYSFVASLAMAFKSPLADCAVWKDCELERLDSLLADNPGKASEEFGFHSASPYDISAPRLSESGAQAGLMRVPAPKDKFARWRENARMACSRYLSVERKAFLLAGKESGLGSLVFHLRAGELADAMRSPQRMKETAGRRRASFDYSGAGALPAQFVCVGGKWLDDEPTAAFESREMPQPAALELKGLPVGAPVEAQGAVVWVDGPSDYRKDVKGKIVASHSFSPSLATLYTQAAGVASQSGGALAHSAIVARELGLACVVKVQGISTLKEGQEIALDGRTGAIRLH